MGQRAFGRVICLMFVVLLVGCASKPKVGQRLQRQGDEIVIAGQYFHTGAPVVLWTDPGGYDAYRTERRFVPWEIASFEATEKEAAENRRLKKDGTIVDSPNRYGIRFTPSTRSATTATTRPSVGRRPNRRGEGGSKLTSEQFDQVRGGGWPLELVQEKVDQFVYHYDVAATSRGCFRTLHDMRNLSVHFMLDLDGTIYQTLDVKERAWHASESNSRSVGIEICNIGAYSTRERKRLESYYRKDDNGKTQFVLPVWAKDSLRVKGFVPRPARDEMIIAQVQGNTYHQYDLTPQQYDSLIKLTAALCTNLPRINPDYPRDANGHLITKVLDDSVWEKYSGLLGHYHVQENKQDPGPAFQWDKVINGARKLMGKKPRPPGDIINNPSLRAKENVAAAK